MEMHYYLMPNGETHVSNASRHLRLPQALPAGDGGAAGSIGWRGDLGRSDFE